MTNSRWATKLRLRIAGEWRHFTTFQPSGRRWPMPLAAALSSGLPLLVGATLGRMDAGLVGSLGGLSFLYLPDRSLHQRMVVLMGCAFGLVASYACGLAVQALGAGFMRPLLIALIALIVTMTVRTYRLPPPGPLFFVMVAAIGAYTPVPMSSVPAQVGTMFLGTLVAAVIAFGYSLATAGRRAVSRPKSLSNPEVHVVLVDGVIIAIAVGASLALAQLFDLPRPYWVPVSCMAVLQGATLRAMWNRKIQRIAGTTVGVALAGGLLLLPLQGWSIALAVMVLTWLVEWLVVRHYGLATVFITPLTILLAEAAHLGSQPEVGALLMARLTDTALGCLVGFAAGLCLLDPRIRSAVERGVLALVAHRQRPGA